MAELQHPTATDLAGRPDANYNYQTLSVTTIPNDLRLSLTSGPTPGFPAPDFSLESTDGARVTLSALRGRPVLLIFGSVT